MARIQLIFQDRAVGDQHTFDVDENQIVEAFNPLRANVRAGDLKVGDRLCTNPGRLERGCEIVKVVTNP